MVGVGGDSNHFPIFFGDGIDREKNPKSIQISSSWLEEEHFVSLIKEKCVPFNGSPRRKNMNTIWTISKSDGSITSSFEDIA